MIVFKKLFNLKLFTPPTLSHSKHISSYYIHIFTKLNNFYAKRVIKEALTCPGSIKVVKVGTLNIKSIR